MPHPSRFAARNVNLIVLLLAIWGGAILHAHADAVAWFWDGSKGEMPQTYGYLNPMLDKGALSGVIDDQKPDNLVAFGGLSLDASRQRYCYFDMDTTHQGILQVYFQPAPTDLYSELRVIYCKGNIHGNQRAIYRVDMRDHAQWEGTMLGIRVTLQRPFAPRTALRFYRAGTSAEPLDTVDGQAVIPLQLVPLPEWRTDRERIDIAKTPAGEIHPRRPKDDWTVALWYFGAWEPEYAHGGWEIMSHEVPGRLPLLYDSSDPESHHYGIMYYRNSHRRAMDWHVKWMAENGVNLMLWDWYPRDNKGELDVTWAVNRPLEVGFLGKEKIGGPPVPTNRFADKIQFAVMWTNHFGAGGNPKQMFEYVIKHFMNQPNYYKIDGRPLFIVHGYYNLMMDLGGKVENLRPCLEGWRAQAKAAGLPNPFIVSSEAWDGPYVKQVIDSGFDGAMQYAAGLLGLGGVTESDHQSVDGVVRWKESAEDFESQTLPGHMLAWHRFADYGGRNYLLSGVPMMDQSVTRRPGCPVLKGTSPEGLRRMVRAAKATQQSRGLRKFLALYAFNEWYEGGYLEPSTQYGTQWLRVLRDEFAGTESTENKPAGK